MPSLDLNEPQICAVGHAGGPLLVFAGAGSGKTRVITYRVANLLLEHRVPPYRILTVTFTNKAAGELKSRLVALVGESLVRDLWVGTFHAICARLLRRYHEEANLDRRFTIYDETDQRSLMSRVLKDLGVQDRALSPKAALQLVQAEKREGRGPDQVRISSTFPELLCEVYRRYQGALAAASAVDFEDLLVLIMRLAEAPESPAGRELRTRFDHVLVDEFQDTNLVQYRLVRALAAATRNLTVVGDDDQAIYRWRGADVRLIRGFRRDFPDAKCVKLEQNYRSTANIVRAALGVIAPAYEREDKRLWTAAAAGDKVRVCLVRDEREEAAFVARAIRAAVAASIPAQQIAVFYRVHAQSRVLEEALRSENVPYRIIGGLRFFDRAEIKDTLSYLRLIDNPRSDADLERIINTPARGIGAKTLSHLREAAANRGTSEYDAIDAVLRGGLGNLAQKRLVAFRDLIEELRRDALRMGPHDLAKRVLERSGYRSALQEEDSAESDARLENLQELLGSIAEYEQEVANDGQEPELSGYLERVSLVTAVDDLSDAPAVNLMTVHAAKGLEFTIVLLTGMEEEVFPYRGLGEDQMEELDEERRLAYVAITRAREQLVIIHAGQRTLFGQTRYLEPSRFLADLPPDALRYEYPQGARPGLSRGTAPEEWGERHRPRVSELRRALVSHSPARHEWPSSRFAAHEDAGGTYVDPHFFDDVASGEEGASVECGSRVRHRRFGEGIVEAVEAGDSPKIVARFPGFGVRKVLAKVLEPV